MEGTELTSPRRYSGTELYLLEESKTWLCACVSLCPVDAALVPPGTQSSRL